MPKRKLTTKQSKNVISNSRIMLFVIIFANLDMLISKTNIVPFAILDIGLIIAYFILRKGVQRKELARQGGWFKLVRRYGLFKTFLYIFDEDALNR